MWSNPISEFCLCRSLSLSEQLAYKMWVNPTQTTWESCRSAFEQVDPGTSFHHKAADNSKSVVRDYMLHHMAMQQCFKAACSEKYAHNGLKCYSELSNKWHTILSNKCRSIEKTYIIIPFEHRRLCSDYDDSVCYSQGSVNDTLLTQPYSR